MNVIIEHFNKAGLNVRTYRLYIDTYIRLPTTSDFTQVGMWVLHMTRFMVKVTEVWKLRKWSISVSTLLHQYACS